MARYIDADELLNKLPDDLPYKASVKRVLIQAPTADVVPKSEVDWLYQQIDNYSQEVMYHDDITKMKVDEAKTEVAREIFEEIDTIIDNNTYKSYLPNSSLWSKGYKINQIIVDVAELKKKYTGEE